MTKQKSRKSAKAQTGNTKLVTVSVEYNPQACVYCRADHQKNPNRIPFVDGLDCNGDSLFLSSQTIGR
jgi:hypothetical protein